MEGTTARSVNPRGSGERLREELIAAALRLLSRGGRDAEFTLRGVAREAGVAAPSVYAHFASVNDLGVAVLERLGGEIATHVFAPIPAGASARERVATLARNYVHWGLKNPGHYTAAMEGRALRLIDDAGEVGKHQLDGFIAAVVAELVALPNPPADPVVAAFGLWAAAHGVVSLRIAKPYHDYPDVDAQVDWIIDAAVQVL